MGDTLSFNTREPNSRVNVAAALEPDADCDGVGDESQDPSIDPSGCNPPAPPPADGGGGDAVAPDTQITAGPKAKTKSKTASFSFSSTEPGSTFECKLDDGGFEPCSSPEDVKVKKGKHSFQVRAEDAAGNVDGSPLRRAGARLPTSRERTSPPLEALHRRPLAARLEPEFWRSVTRGWPVKGSCSGGRTRQLLAEGEVDAVVEHWPECCSGCGRGFDPGERAPAADPYRHQVFELPEIAVEVTEHRAHAVRCPDCGKRTRDLPAHLQRALGALRRAARAGQRRRGRLRR